MIVLLIFLACGSAVAQVNQPIPIPQVQIGEGHVFRTSNHKNAEDRYLPPWQEVNITQIFGLKEKPSLGDTVTILPLGVDVAPIDLGILKTEEKDVCGQHWWDTQLEPVKEKSFFEAVALSDGAEEYPFDVAVLYPAVKFARQVKKRNLTLSMLPPGITPHLVKAAIDLTHDGIPDVLIAEYCCLHPKKAAKSCDLTCSKTFKKVKNAWKLIDTSTPC